MVISLWFRVVSVPLILITVLPPDGWLEKLRAHIDRKRHRETGFEVNRVDTSVPIRKAREDHLRAANRKLMRLTQMFLKFPYPHIVDPRLQFWLEV